MRLDAAGQVIDFAPRAALAARDIGQSAKINAVDSVHRCDATGKNGNGAYFHL